eukprot:scaffold6860_cov297-Chaetoceros_neogracile.AAC.14
MDFLERFPIICLHASIAQGAAQWGTIAIAIAIAIDITTRTTGYVKDIVTLFLIHSHDPSSSSSYRPVSSSYRKRGGCKKVRKGSNRTGSVDGNK